MLAILYLAAMTYLGDRICRSFYRFASGPHRIATSFLVGLLLSTWITYLGALAFAWTARPMVFGNLVFLAVFVLAIYKLPLRPSSEYLNPFRTRPVRFARWDWILMGAFSVFACWLMFANLGFKDGSFLIGFKAWSDFGANLSLSQSFALGHNFPTEHPFFPGQFIKYHFLFWFQAANLEVLGLNLVSAVNLLSILSLLALLILIVTFAEILFDSRVVGRIAAFLFFFSTSLSYIPFLRSQRSIREALTAIAQRTEFVSSGYPFRGEGWGVLTVAVFANQRHLISGVGILFVVLIFLIGFYKQNRLVSAATEDQRYPPKIFDSTENAAFAVAEDQGDPPKTLDSTENAAGTVTEDQCYPPKILASTENAAPWLREEFPPLWSFIFSGALIGLLPYWNSAIFMTALIVVGSFFILLPRRSYSALLIGIVLLLGLPQVILFRWGNVVRPDQSILHWGYTLGHPKLFAVVKYLGWTFGFKWLLIFIALALLSGFHRRVFLAVSSLLVVVFLFQLSPDIFNNHKLLNMWSIFASIYAAYALWRIARVKRVGLALAAVLTVLTISEGAINLFPFRNDPELVVPYKNDQLTMWLLNNTKPSDVFLTQNLLTHPIFFTGRKVFLGNTLFPWTAGYDVQAREEIYRRMFQERNPLELVRLLNRYHIAYVGIDDGVRENRAIQPLNEAVYQKYFQKVFEDTGHHYANITIYKVPVGVGIGSSFKN